LIPPDAFPPSIEKILGVSQVVGFPSFTSALDVIHHAIVNDVIGISLRGQAKAKVDILTSIEEDLIKPTRLLEQGSLHDAAGGGHGAPSPGFTLKGSVKETLAIMSW
tara:strand:- start:38 stop:358 length:321 start_codon:yes stop_codon:yes gene_type:complete